MGVVIGIDIAKQSYVAYVKGVGCKEFTNDKRVIRKCSSG